MMKNHFMALFSAIMFVASVTISHAEILEIGTDTLSEAITHAETIEIGTGTLSGEYTNIIVPAISDALLEYGYTAVAEQSASSQENINNVLSGKTLVALSPLDVAALSMTAENDPDESLLLVGGKLVPEALFCAAYKGGTVVTYDDLTDKQATPLKISVGNKNGATARTFQYLMKLDPDLKSIEFSYEKNTGLELNRLVSGRRDLVCFITMPNPENKLIERVMEDDELVFITINNPFFDRAKIGKIRIYDIMEVPVSSGFLGFGQDTVKTLVTWIGVVVNEKKIDAKLLEALTTVVTNPDLLPSNSLIDQAKQLFDNVVDGIGGIMD